MHHLFESKSEGLTFHAKSNPLCVHICPVTVFCRNFHHLKLLLGNKKVLKKHKNTFHHDDWFSYVKCFIIIFVTSTNFTTCCNFTRFDFVILPHISWYIECPQLFITFMHRNIKDNLSQYKKNVLSLGHMEIKNRTFMFLLPDWSGYRFSFVRMAEVQCCHRQINE